MNWIDLSIMAVAIHAAYRGYRTGFIRQLVALLAILLATLFAVRFAPYCEVFIQRYFELSPRGLRAVSVSLSFVLIILSVRYIGRFVERLIAFSLIKTFNRVLGALVGPLVVLSFLSMLFVVVDTIFPPRVAVVKEGEEQGFSDLREQSQYYNAVKGILPSLLDLHRENTILNDYYPIKTFSTKEEHLP